MGMWLGSVDRHLIDSFSATLSATYQSNTKTETSVLVSHVREGKATFPASIIACGAKPVGGCRTRLELDNKFCYFARCAHGQNARFNELTIMGPSEKFGTLTILCPDSTRFACENALVVAFRLAEAIEFHGMFPCLHAMIGLIMSRCHLPVSFCAFLCSHAWLIWLPMKHIRFGSSIAGSCASYNSFRFYFIVFL